MEAYGEVAEVLSKADVMADTTEDVWPTPWTRELLHLTKCENMNII